MRLRQLSDLRSDIRLRADVVGATQRYPDTEVNEYWNQAWTEVYGLLARTGEDYYLSESPSYSTVSGQDTYYSASASGVTAGTAVLPTDIFDIKGVDAQVMGPRWSTCQRFQFEQRNDYQDVDFAWPLVPMYALRGSGTSTSITFLPVPNAIYTFRVWYYPSCPRLVNDSDTIDGGNGWERMAIDIAARWLAERDENYELCARLDQAIAAADARIRAEAANRNIGQAPRLRRSMRYKKLPYRWPAGRS